MPPEYIHPGEHLAEELRELEMSAAELARRLDVPTNRVTEILNGRRAITGDTALRLAERKSGKSIKALPTLRRAHLALSSWARTRRTERIRVEGPAVQSETPPRARSVTYTSRQDAYNPSRRC